MIYTTRVRRCWRGPSLLQEKYALTSSLSLLMHPALAITAQLQRGSLLGDCHCSSSFCSVQKSRGLWLLCYPAKALGRRKAQASLLQSLPHGTPDLSALEQHKQLYLSQVLTGCLKSSTRAGQLAWLQEELTWWKKAEEKKAFLSPFVRQQVTHACRQIPKPVSTLTFPLFLTLS